MVEANNYQMAIDLLCCHLGITEEEAKRQLGLSSDSHLQKQVSEYQQAMMGMAAEK